MRFSIVTCTRNSERYLSASIDSVTNQDYGEIERIFVDGGSTDATLDIIRATPGNVKIVENICGSISHAMNVGIKTATGDVVAHLHSDDYYAHPRVLSHVSRALHQSGAEWLFGRCLSDIDGVRTAERSPAPRYSYRRLLKGNFIPHPAVFIRRHLFDRTHGFDEHIKYAMDYDLWLKLGRLAEPLQLDEHLAVFRRHPESFSTANPLLALRDDFAVRLRHASSRPWTLAYHWLHYLVRRRRLQRRLARGH